MAEIVNLRLARKAKRRSKKAAEASINRLKFGQSKSAKVVAELDKRRSQRVLDGMMLEKD